MIPRLQIIITVLFLFGIGNPAKAQDNVMSFGPIIERIEVKGGSAWDVVTQIRAGLPDDALAGFAVDVPEAELRKIRVELIDVRAVPLGLALEYLTAATKAFRPHYESGLWTLRPISFEGPSGGLAIRLYEVSEALLAQIGINYESKDGLVDASGRLWPGREGWSAHYSPDTKQLLLCADSDFHDDISALVRLARRGYTGLTIKNANKAEMATPRKPSD